MGYSSPEFPGPLRGPQVSPGGPQTSPAGPPDETEIVTGADLLLSSAAPSGLSDPYSSSQDSWMTAPQSIDAYTGIAGGGENINAFTGSQTADPFTGVINDFAGNNAFVGGQNVDPMTGIQNVLSRLRVGGARQPAATVTPSQVVLRSIRTTIGYHLPRYHRSAETVIKMLIVRFTTMTARRFPIGCR